jgi:soluble lytic murein transglycosylase-like protein/TolA-binding protein
MIKQKLYILLIALLLAGNLGANNLLHQADSLYIHQNYFEALNRYRILLDRDHFLREDFTINFKVGNCYLINKNYVEAEKIFQQLRQKSDKIPEFVDYYLFLSSYHKDKSWLVLSKGRKFLTDYSGHFLADSVLFKIADYQFEIGEYNKAFKDYARLSVKKSLKSHKAYFMSQMSLCRWHLKDKNDALERMYQVMKKYPSDKAALEIADFFDSYETPSEKYDFAIASVYLKHGEYQKLTERLETFIQNTKSAAHKEKARYYLVQIYYSKQKYQTALYGFKNLLEELKYNSIESRLRLSIARCYLRLDQKKEAAIAYLDYAKRYPRRRMAVECTWKAGWIYEELGMINEEINVYKGLLRHWPRSKYRNETKFRIGLSYLRLGNYNQAEKIFKEIENSRLSEFHRSRASFWLAKSYQMRGNTQKSNEILSELASNVFASYYTLKSFTLMEDQVDSLAHIKEMLSDTKNPLRFYTDSMEGVMIRFEDLFLIREILGHDIALAELSEKKYNPDTLKGWIALAEIYKKLGAYNHAFRIYDYINNKHFSDLTTLEKPFLLKESYPLYYDNIIEGYGSNRYLDKNLVLALIRAESGFNRMAHSWADAYGLMQIVPRTARALASELSVDCSIPNDLFDPDININLGTHYLHSLLKQFSNKPEYALAGYNAGPHRVSRWKTFKFSDDIDFFVENIEYSQTRTYVRRVMRNYWIYTILDQVN